MKFIMDIMLVYLTPIILVIIGGWLKKKPVKKISYSEGYCTPYAQRSQEVWEYAQNIAPAIMIKVAAVSSGIITVILLISMFGYKDYKEMVSLCANSWMIISPAYFIIVEMLLRRRFSVSSKVKN